MAADWAEIPLEDVCERVSVGHVGPTSEFFCGPEGIPLLRSQNVRPGRLDLTDVRYVTNEFHAQTRKSHLRAGDLVIVRVGQNRGDCCIVPEGLGELNCANVVFARPKRELAGFLGHYFRSAAGQQALLSISSGSAQPVLNTTAIARLRVPVPTVAEASAIAHILGTLDEKIELNRRTHETLEAVARALFKSWLIDFDPVRAKSEGRSSLRMDAQTATLFPDGFADSEVGLIPKGWSVVSLDAIADFRNGLALQKFRPAEGEPRLPVVKIAQLRTGEADSGEWARADIPRECVLEDGDVVFSWSGSLMVVIWCGGRAALNQHLFRVTSQRHPKWFYLSWLQTHLAEFQRIAGEKATTMGHIQRHHLTAAKCVVPSAEIFVAAGRVLEPVFERCTALALESRLIAHTRDALLPRLLSGELSVPAAERAVGDVA